MDLDIVLNVLGREPATPLDGAEVALHLARDEYPDLDVEAYLSELDSMAREARAYVRGDLQARVSGLCRYLFHEMGFHGNAQEYYDPRNSYLNQVLDRRTGIPISLSLVAMAIGNRTGLEVVGVGLPGHFIAKAVTPDREILFDPFHGGRQLTPDSCEQLVEQVTGKRFLATADSLHATPVGWMVLRMLTNLKGIYLNNEDFSRAIRVIERLRQLNPADPLQRRDLGVSLVRAGQPGPAINHLEAYLAAVPKGTDSKSVKRMLDRAHSDLAKWN